MSERLMRRLQKMKQPSNVQMWASRVTDMAYAHNLCILLKAGRRCLVCWSPDHIMYSCLERSAAMIADIDRKRSVPSYAESPVNTSQYCRTVKRVTRKLTVI